MASGRQRAKIVNLHLITTLFAVIVLVFFQQDAVSVVNVGQSAEIVVSICRVVLIRSDYGYRSEKRVPNIAGDMRLPVALNIIFQDTTVTGL